MIDVLLVLLVTSLACAVVGVFLVLRRLAMTADAISHSVLLGIVLAYLLIGQLDSQWLFVGAAILGLVTVIAIEAILKTGLVREDAAVGIVFPLFFSIAVILLSRYARNTHLCVDTVLVGEVIMAPFNRMTIMGVDLPVALWIMGALFLVGIVLFIVFYKELKVSSFDREFAALAGFSLPLIHYGLMAYASFTAVFAFDAVGTILVVAFLIAPGASAYLITKDLKWTVVVALLYATFNCLVGYAIGVSANLSISGACATVAGATFLVTVILQPDGVLARELRAARRRREFRRYAVLYHVANHTGTAEQGEELGVTTISGHLDWSEPLMRKNVAFLKRQGLIREQGQVYELTDKGREVMERHADKGGRLKDVRAQG